MPDFLSWMPPDMPVEEKEAWARAHPGDPHAAAAAAWDSQAATLAAIPAVTSAGTGRQSVVYAAGGSSAFQQAQDRANWHRARSKPRSIHVLTGNEPDPVFLEGA